MTAFPVLFAQNFMGIGYFAGGENNSDSLGKINAIDRLNLNTEVAGTCSAVLSSARSHMAGYNSSVKGYLSGGDIGGFQTNVTQSMTFYNETMATLATMPANGSAGFGVNSTSNGYICGQLNAPANTINRYAFSNDARTQIAAVITPARGVGSSANSTADGFIFGGYTGTVYSSVIDRLIFSGETCSVLGSTLSAIKGDTGAVNSGAFAYISGSQTGSTMIEKFNLTSFTRTDSGKVLTSSRRGITGVNSHANGYFSGTDPSNVTDRMAFVTETVTSIGATVATRRTNQTGFQSGSL